MTRRSLTNIGGDISLSGNADDLEEALLATADPKLGLTHAFHPYPGRMHPGIAATLLQKIPSPLKVLDPFCGGGTTLVECLVAGHQATGIDLNVIAVRVAQTKTRLTDNAYRAEFLRIAQEVSEKNVANVKAKKKSIAPLDERDRRSYSPHTLLEMAGLWERIQSLSKSHQKRDLEAVFSSMVIKFSLHRSDSDHRKTEAKIGKYIPTNFFLKKAGELSAAWQGLETALPENVFGTKVRKGNALELSQATKGGEFDAVISSPPYGGTYDYHAHHRLRAAWFGLDTDDFQKLEIGSRRTQALGAGLWDEQMQQFLRSLRQVLRDRAPVYLYLGDAEYEERIDALKQIQRLAPDSDFEFVGAATQSREDQKGGARRGEHLIHLASK